MVHSDRKCFWKSRRQAWEGHDMKDVVQTKDTNTSVPPHYHHIAHF